MKVTSDKSQPEHSERGYSSCLRHPWETYGVVRRYIPFPDAIYKTPRARLRIPNLLKELGPESAVLNIGAGCSDFGNNMLNLDIAAFANVDIVGDVVHLPFQDNAFHAVVSQAVLEHVRWPAEAVHEIYRVLKPGGYTYHEIPFIQGYHSAPDDFQRYTIDGIEQLFHRFQLVEKGVITGPSSAVAWIVRDYLAMLFSFNSLLLYRFNQRLFGWPLSLLKYLDCLLEQNRFAPVLASGFFYLGQKV